MKQTSDKTRSPLTVLVLDDLAMWREIVKFILERELGISPIVASSGREALDLMQLFPVDVVVSDLNMPEMSGLQFLHRARSLFPKTKFVMMTADFVSSTMYEECVERGALALIAKDQINPTLLKLLRNLTESD